MKEGLDQGKTCIECHKGVAHKLPASDDDIDD
jgi:cytochrome c-type protein NapC/trimethylamine-N-oxide reductase cytochrome c-type subunit TorC